MEDNSANMLSRLVHSKSWWQGPEWLQLDEKSWLATLDTSCQELPEVKLKIKSEPILQLEVVLKLITRIGNFNFKKEQTWCLRWRTGQYLTNDELNQATVLIKIAQKK